MFANSPKDGKDARLSRYDHLIVHCTATQENQNVDAAWVNREHLKRGFENGNGYHAVITRSGEWQDADSGFSARPIGNAGAHVGDCGPGWNSRSFGVSLAGGISHNGTPEANYSDAQYATLETGLRKFVSLHPNPASIILLGHRDLIKIKNAPPKACPCFDVRHWWADGNLPLDGIIPPRNVEAGCDEARVEKNPRMTIPKTHLIVPGDSLWKLSETYGISVIRLKELNQIVDTDHIKVGATIKLS